MSDRPPSTPYVSILEKTQERIIPLTIHWELTHRCNIRCRHCYLPPGKPSAQTSPEEAREVLRRLQELGTLYLILSGGEPFLRPDIRDILREASQRGFAMRILTNGTRIDEACADVLAQSTVMGVEISILGPEASTHDGITGVKGSFDAAARAIELLVSRGLAVTIKCPVTRENYADFERTHALAENWGCKLLFDVAIVPRLDGDASPMTMALEESQLENFFRKESTGKAPDGPPPLDASPCGAGQNAFALTPAADVIPCVAVRTVLGNLLHHDFDVIRRHPALLTWRAVRLRDLPQCSRCDILPYCLRCPGVALQETGDLLGASPTACRVANVLAAVVEGRRPCKAEGPIVSPDEADPDSKS